MAGPNFNVWFQGLYRWFGFGGTSQYSGEQLSRPTTGQPGGTPVNVTEDTAMVQSAVFGAVRLLVETVVGIPMFIHKFTQGAWVKDLTDELYIILQLRPNPHMTHVEFWEAVLLNLVLRGNGYAYILRNDLGMPIGLYPMAAAQVQPLVLKDGTGWYVYHLDGTNTLYPEEDVLHFRILGNGRVGLSPLAYGARSIGIASASDIYAGTFFSRGGKPGGVLTIDRILTPKQREELRTKFAEIHENTDNAHKLFVLEAGMKYQQVQLDPSDLQLIESRAFNVKDIARFWGVPAFLLNESEGSTSWGTGLEQQMIGFYSLTVKPYCNRIAAHLVQKLIPLPQQRKRKVMYDYDELAAVDLVTKANYLSTLSNNAMMTANEARARLNLPAVDDPNADKLRVQGAMLPLAKLGQKPPAAKTQPASAVPQPDPGE